MPQEPTKVPLSIEGLNVRYARQNDYALRDITYQAPTGEMIAILGPNGAGKSTLIKTCISLTQKESGTIDFFGAQHKNVRDKIAYMAQRQEVDWSFPINVLDVVLMGLSTQIGWFKRLNASHKEQAFDALKQVQMDDMAQTQIGALSGGQQQRVFLARTLVQKPELYILDEPLAGVDAKAQEIILNVLQDIKNAGKTIIAVHHDLIGAENYFDSALLLNRTAIAQGKIKDVLAPENIEKAYGIPLKQQNAHG